MRSDIVQKLNVHHTIETVSLEMSSAKLTSLRNLRCNLYGGGGRHFFAGVKSKCCKTVGMKIGG